jgi:hypothetical protein
MESEPWLMSFQKNTLHNKRTENNFSLCSNLHYLNNSYFKNVLNEKIDPSLPKKKLT